MIDDFKILDDYKNTIFLAEIGVLIHDLGKLSEEFVKSKGKNGSAKDKHTKILNQHPDLKAVLSSDEIKKLLIQPFFIENNQTCDLSLDRLISKHHDKVENSPIYYYKLLAAGRGGCDGVDSGVDKGNPISQQVSTGTYISTAFGYEKRKIQINNLNKQRNNFCSFLKKQFENIIDIINLKGNIKNEIKKVRNKVLKSTESYFLKTLGETRRAANDVTLWDHSYSVANLYKAALIGIILNKNDSNFKLPYPKQLKWKICSININGLDFWMKSEKIGDIFARKKLLEDSFNRIKELFETEIPLGNEIYRDENCISFLVFEDFDKKLKYNGKTIEENIYDIFNEKKEKDHESMEGELLPQIEVSDCSRGAVVLGDVITKIPVTNKVLKKEIENHWNRKENNKEKEKGKLEICHVCGLRAVGYPYNNAKSDKAKERDVCTICLSRRENRSKNWIKNTQKKKDTIWIDEVSDPNNRVALIVGKFDLEKWLDGSYLNTLFIKTLCDLYQRKGIQGICSYDDLLDAVKQSFKSEEIKILTNKIPRKDFLKAIGGESFNKYYYDKPTEEYFKDIVVAREKEKLEEELGNYDKWDIETKARLLISFLFRKNPSYGRIRRIWETTKNFWADQSKNIDKLLKERTRYEIDCGKKIPGVASTHAYYLKISGTFIPVVVSDGECKKMLIVDCEENFPPSLQALINDKNHVKELDVDIYGPKKQKEIISITIQKGMVHKHSTYYPHINILKTPKVFMSLVPANKAIEIAQKIKSEYNSEFSKVKNRLPMNLSFIFMNKKMPLYIAMDCAKRYLECTNKEMDWIVKGLCDKKLKNGEFKKRLLTLENDNQIFQTEIDLTLGNGEIDYYHPYFIVKKGSDLDQRKTYFETYKKDKLIHVTDLVKNDEIYYIPSYFDFIFLDSNIRRFDISYKNEKRPHTLFKSGPRPYFLEEIDLFKEIWEILKKRCDNTKLNNFESLLISKIKEWNLNTVQDLKNEEIKELVQSSIANILEIKKKDDDPIINMLYKSVISGMFFDIKELYHTILKEKLGGNTHE